MKSKKRVFITVNPDLLAGKRLQTVRSMVTCLHSLCDLHVVPIDEYDFGRKRVKAYKRIADGKFESRGWVKPEGDVWIVYTDGYWLDPKDYGFKHNRDFLNAQFHMHESHVENGRIKLLINTAEAERNCLKSWFAEIESKKWGVIPTYCFSNWKEVHDLLKSEKTIVAKPNWGGAGTGIYKITSAGQLDAFRKILDDENQSLKLDYCFQPLVSGPEKRLWFVNGKCVGGRIVHGRYTPWSDYTSEFRIEEYWKPKSRVFQTDVEKATKLCAKSGLTIGSIDFIGSYINEINGAGTTFTQYDGMTKIVDVRKPLTDYLASLVLE